MKIVLSPYEKYVHVYSSGYEQRKIKSEKTEG